MVISLTSLIVMLTMLAIRDYADLKAALNDQAVPVAVALPDQAATQAKRY